MVFIILIYADGTTEAKPLASAAEKAEKMPTIELINIADSYAIDCWINVENEGAAI